MTVVSTIVLMSHFHKSSRIIVLGALLLLMFVSIYAGLTQNKNNETKSPVETKSASQSSDISSTKQLQVGTKVIEVEVADTKSEITRGLSYRDSLALDTGMFFILPDREQVSFWMYEMKFPIDIIWIDNGTIVGIEKNTPVPNSDDIPTFRAPQEVTNVLEVNAGFAQSNNLQIGNKVTLYEN